MKEKMDAKKFKDSMNKKIADDKKSKDGHSGKC